MRARLPIGIGFVLVSVTSLLFTVSSAILLNSAKQTESQKLVEHLARVEAALQTQLLALGNVTTDYATWDDTYAFAQGKNPTYPENALSAVTFTSSRANWLAIAQDSEHFLYTAAFDAKAEEIVPPSSDLQSVLQTFPILFKFTDKQPTQQGILSIAGQVTLVASRPILRTDESGPAAGVFIFGQTLDVAKVARLAASTKLSLSVYPTTALPDESHRQIYHQLRAGQAQIIQPINTEAIAAYGLIRDFNNQPVALLRIDAPRLVYQQALLSLRYLALSLLGASIVSGFIIWQLLERSLQYLRERDRIQQALQQEAALRQSELRYREKAEELELTLQELHKTQAKLLQSEKMSSLGQLVAGIAHEINNPIGFIYGNINHARQYSQSLLNLVSLYQQHIPQPPAPIQEAQADLDLAFIAADLPKLLHSMQAGAERIRSIVFSLRTFSHADESGCKAVDIHQGIDSTLLILQHRLTLPTSGKTIQVTTDYGELPRVECYPGQLNQVFLQILNNAIDALQHPSIPDKFLADPPPPLIQIQTRYLKEDHREQEGDRPTGQIQIRIINNGPPIPQGLQSRLFDPFFTTKPVGQGTGLGLTMCYQIIVETHHGTLRCHSAPDQHTEFIIQIPVSQTTKRFKA
ncbi:MAG: CHASE4 domain-containing protein [Cyanobacteriota bacterium]